MDSALGLGLATDLQLHHSAVQHFLAMTQVHSLCKTERDGIDP